MQSSIELSERSSGSRHSGQNGRVFHRISPFCTERPHSVGAHLKTRVSEQRRLLDVVERPDPSTATTTNGALRQIPDPDHANVNVWGGTLMRHRLPTAQAISALTLTVPQSSCGNGLVSPPGRTQLSLAASRSTSFAAIALATITTDVDCEKCYALRIATSTHAEGSFDQHHGSNIPAIANATSLRFSPAMMLISPALFKKVRFQVRADNPE
jgi:hypothetical protein